MNRIAITVAAVLAGVFLAATAASADVTSLTVPNHSFELSNYTATDGDVINPPTIYNPSSSTPNVDDILLDWVVAPNTWHRGGQLNPDDNFLAGTTGNNPLPAPADGIHCAAVHFGGGTTSNDRSYFYPVDPVATIEADTDYTLTIAVGSTLAATTVIENGPIWLARLDLEANGTQAATVTVDTLSIPAGTFQDFSVTLTKETIDSNGWVGADLEILIMGRSPGYNRVCTMFDNVRVEADGPAVVIPEPATMALLGIGGLAALLRRRK